MFALLRVGSSKTSFLFPFRSHVIQNSIRTLIVPYGRVPRKTVYQHNNYGARFRPRIRATTENNHNYRKPTLQQATAIPLSVQEMDNATLVMLGANGMHEARREILKRHIMSIDKVSYDEAEVTYQTIAEKNKEGMFLLSLPYQIAMGVALTAGLGSLPMVFDLATAQWFNEAYVTTDVPEPADLETMLEIGSWTWNWMEPPLGTISFVLLALQFSRAQMDNLGIKPYTHRIKMWRGRRLAEAFPRYDADILIQYCKTSSIYNP